MSNFPIVDIILYCWPSSENRIKLLSNTLKSIQQNTDKNLYNLHISCDGTGNFGPELLDIFNDNKKIINNILWHKENSGLPISFDTSFGFVKNLREHYTDVNKRTKYVVLMQDDININNSEWLNISVKTLNYFRNNKREIIELGYKYLAFVSLYYTKVHDNDIVGGSSFLGKNILWHKLVTECCFVSDADFYFNNLPIPIQDIDKETKNFRGKPNEGLGSGTIFRLLRTESSSVLNTGGINIVFPGIVSHAGENCSSWYKLGNREN